MKRVLVDNGASVDILFYDAFLKMKYDNSKLTPSNMLIYGFDREESQAERTTQLTMTKVGSLIMRPPIC